MAALKFWKWTEPDSELGISRDGGAFIVWNPDTGEAQFFHYGHHCFDDNWEPAFMEPFDGYQMAVVNKRYHEYLEDHPEVAKGADSVVQIDKDAFDSFMRGL